jgi:hypothetical protein
MALVRTDVSEELSSSFIRVTSIDELGTIVKACVVPSSPILVTLMKEALSSSENVGSYKSHTAQHPRRPHSS